MRITYPLYMRLLTLLRTCPAQLAVGPDEMTHHSLTTGPAHHLSPETTDDHGGRSMCRGKHTTWGIPSPPGSSPSPTLMCSHPTL